jgi:hypothetical protein
MIDVLFRAAARFKRAGIILDTNLFMLLLAGLYDRSKIGTKRTSLFTPEDFDLLLLILGEFDRIVTTPHILTEVSNLSDALGKPFDLPYFEAFIRQIGLAHEIYEPSKDLTRIDGFLRFGLTDISILSAALSDYAVVTDDLDHFIHLQSKSIEAINFTYFRIQFTL